MLFDRLPFWNVWIWWVMSVNVFPWYVIEVCEILKTRIVGGLVATYGWLSARFPRGSRPPPPLPSWWCAAHSGCCNRGRRAECVPTDTWVRCPVSEMANGIECEHSTGDYDNGNDTVHLRCSASFNAYFCIGPPIIISYSYLNWLPDKIQPAICTKFRIDFDWYGGNHCGI